MVDEKEGRRRVGKKREGGRGLKTEGKSERKWGKVTRVAANISRNTCIAK